MSVVGIDIGNINCYVAVARAGGIETVANEYSDRCTPAIVGFNDAQRIVGISAKNQMIMNLKATVTQFKRLIGRKFDEPEAKAEMNRHSNTFVRLEDGDIGVQVQYKGEATTYKPEQLLAMLVSELKHTAQTNLQCKVTECVVSIPSYYTDYQRRCFLQAIRIAGVNCLKLMNETSAVALNYGLFKQDLPAPTEKPRHVAFVDCGHSSLQVCIAAFNKGKIKILATGSDANLGGRDFDDRLKHYFANAFLDKYKIDARTNPKAWTRLGADVEKIKKQMSTNSTDLPLNIECFMDDKDVSHKINRLQFEEISQDILDRVNVPLCQALQESGLKVEEIDVVELVGGSARIPSMKAIVEKVFGKSVSTTLNLDEAVSRGCAIQCAMLSHTVKVRDIEILDAAPYPVNISWDSVKVDEPPGEMEVFKKHHQYPFTKMLTFPYRVQPFRFKAYYRDDVDTKHFERKIGEFIVNAEAPNESSEKVKVKVKLRMDINGCFTVSSATQIETLPAAPEPMETTGGGKEAAKEAADEPKEVDGTNHAEENQTPKKPEETKSESKSESKKEKKDKKEEKKAEAKKLKKPTKATELKVTTNQLGISPVELNRLIEIENELICAMQLEKQRSDAKNAVEEYIYKMREKIYCEYEKYITEDDRETFSGLLSQTEDWLYEDGENEQKQVYTEKLKELKKLGDPVVNRCNAHSGLPSAFELFGAAITHYRKILDLYAKKDEKYNHLEEGEMKKVHKKIDEKQDWFNQKMQDNGKCPPHVDPTVLPSQVLMEKKLMEDFCNPIVNKSKPKVEPPKEEKKDSGDAAPKPENTDSKKDDGKPAATPEPEKMETEQNGETKSNLDMEVD